MKSLLNFFAAGKDAPPITDPAVIDAEFRTHRRNIIFVITLSYGLGYVCRLALNVVKKPLMDGGIFTPEEMGLIGSMPSAAVTTVSGARRIRSAKGLPTWVSPF